MTASEEGSLLGKKAASTVFFISFVLPNLLFSGSYFFSTLHLMKWAGVLFPLAAAAFAAGWRILRKGTSETGFRLDGFAVVWLFLLLYAMVQPFWSGLRSPETFPREWFFFASMWFVYVLAFMTADRPLLRLLLWGSLVNAAVSVIFAELQVRGLNQPFFFILPTPGHYIANTGQQNMLALWLAVGGLNGAFLLLTGREKGKETLFGIPLLLAVVFWGLVSTTSRSALLSFAVGFASLGAFFIRNTGRVRLRRILGVTLLFAAVFGMNILFNEGRWGLLLDKMENVVTNPLSIAQRDSIWATSWIMFTAHPLGGVGLGQYKWHYLEAQRGMMQRWPSLQWQFTHWAHNEFLQWFCEAGLAGGIVFLFLWGWWWISALLAFLKKRPCSSEAYWGSSMAALFLFDAVWTRPFHRIENAVWLALALAMTNRELLVPLFPTPSPEEFHKGGRILALTLMIVSSLGIAYLASGMAGDRLLSRAFDLDRSPLVREELLEKAMRIPLVRDIAEKQLAYHYIDLGERARDPELTAKGLNALMAFFEKQPHVKELNFLREWSLRLDNKPVYEDLASYGPPRKEKGK